MIMKFPPNSFSGGAYAENTRHELIACFLFEGPLPFKQPQKRRAVGSNGGLIIRIAGSKKTVACDTRWCGDQRARQQALVTQHRIRKERIRSGGLQHDVGAKPPTAQFRQTVTGAQTTGFSAVP